MTRLITRTTIAILLAVLLTVGFTVATVAPAAAEHDPDDSGLADALQPSDDGLLATAFGALAGVDRAIYAIRGPDDTAEENRDAAVKNFNQHSADFVRYANDRDLHEGEVVQVDCTVDGETATAYIVADFNDSTNEYESAAAVTSTDRDVNHTVELRKNACDNAAGEIEYFHDTFADDDRDVTRKYMSKMASKYAGNIDEPFMGGN